MPILDSADASSVEANETIIAIDDLSFSYDLGKTNTLRNISLTVPAGKVTAFIGPSGCGKSTLLRCLNRMNDLVDTAKVTNGKISILGQDINADDVDAIELRKHVGMVFQKYNPFPKSIYENVAYGLRVQGIKSKKILDQAVEQSLQKAALWSEVKDRLDTSALAATLHRPHHRREASDRPHG
jgi:phosphate transport system ATP-binding protein